DATHKLDIVRAVGADHVIDYAQEDFIESGEQYDLIVDCQCFHSMFDIKRALRPGGVYAMIGGSMLRAFQLLFLNLFMRFSRENRKFCLVVEGPNKGLAELRELIEAGKLVVSLDKTYDLSEVPEALRYFGEGLHKGKIAIVVKR
ncbi:MAG: zinc-binding dehydrogenase, partial [Hyphomicrobiales bacterium]|nr:zinc-binding dehydrogenase [Hyphomicrobiales bacterium]